MSTSHFDILVLGSCPAARMAAALCAKGGRKVLLLESNFTPPPAPWCHASLHLERLLENLGGRACLRPTPPFQVHAGNSRLTFHGRQSLANELLRECPQDQPQILRLLEGLQRQGKQLEELLRRCHGLPLTGLRSRMSFLWQQLLRGQLPGQLHKPLTQTLCPLGTTGRAILETLFSGLALTSVQKLTVAEAALLWHCASRIEALDWAPFSELLRKRFEQFHGKTERAKDLRQLQRRKDRRFEFSLKGHPTATAGRLLLGDAKLADKLPAEMVALGAGFPEQQRFSAMLNLGQASALLAPGVLLDHPHGLRMALPANPGEAIAIEIGSAPASNMTGVLSRVETALPFTELDVVATDTAARQQTSKGRRQPFPGARGPIILAPGLLYCDGHGLLPHLGLSGEAILGTTVANQLLATPQE